MTEDAREGGHEAVRGVLPDSTRLLVDVLRRDVTALRRPAPSTDPSRVRARPERPFRIDRVLAHDLQNLLGV